MRLPPAASSSLVFRPPFSGLGQISRTDRRSWHASSGISWLLRAPPAFAASTSSVLSSLTPRQTRASHLTSLPFSPSTGCVCWQFSPYLSGRLWQVFAPRHKQASVGRVRLVPPLLPPGAIPGRTFVLAPCCLLSDWPSLAPADILPPLQDAIPTHSRCAMCLVRFWAAQFHADGRALTGS